jgi:hypothetical protein
MTESPKKLMNESWRKVLKRLHYPIEVMWYAYVGTWPTR